MKRNIILIVAVGLTVFGAAGIGHASSRPFTGTFHDGPYTGSSPDSGTCGNNWAQDLYIRNFTATANLDGTFNVKETFTKGHFSTVEGQSPGACDTNPGGTIKEGVTGKFKGFLSGTVTNGTFNPNGSCVRTDGLCTTAGWIKGFFGESAVFDVTPFKFVYTASGPDLIFNSWTNADAGNGGNSGDISTGP